MTGCKDRGKNITNAPKWGFPPPFVTPKRYFRKSDKRMDRGDCIGPLQIKQGPKPQEFVISKTIGVSGDIFVWGPSIKYVRPKMTIF